MNYETKNKKVSITLTLEEIDMASEALNLCYEGVNYSADQFGALENKLVKILAEETISKPMNTNKTEIEYNLDDVCHALEDLACNMSPLDIQKETGLPIERCEAICYIVHTIMRDDAVYGDKSCLPKKG